MNTNKITLKGVQLILEDKNTAFASISQNPFVSWAKLIVTDDKPNANNQRVPKEEFDNIIKTGLFMPLKVAYQTIAGHSGTFPIGVITHMKQEGDQIVGLAALWDTERGDEVSNLKRIFGSEGLNVSWELTYTNSEIVDDVEDLKGITMNALTIVENPAYKGRTPIVSLASSKEEEGDNMSESRSDVDMISREDHNKIVNKLESDLQALANEKAQLETVEPFTDELKTELEELRSFKEAAEEREKRESRLVEIKDKFTEAGLEEFGSKYINEKADVVLAMEDSQLEFFIQEMVAIRKGSATEEAEASVSNTDNIPNISGKKESEFSNKDVLKYLESLD